MPIPVWVLLGFAAWTLFILFTTVGSLSLEPHFDRSYSHCYVACRRAARGRVVSQGHPGPPELRGESSCLHGNRRGPTCRTRHQSDPRRISNHDTRCKDLSELDPLAGGTDKHNRERAVRFLFRASDVHDRDGCSCRHLGAWVIVNQLCRAAPASDTPDRGT